MSLESDIESILFFLGEPTSFSRLARITKKKESEIAQALEILKTNLQGRGLAVLEKDDKVFLTTSPGASEILKTLQKEELEGDLSRAALEVLTIAIYYSPVTRAEIDYIRGVNSSFTLRALMIRGLVERTTHPKDARAYIYKPSFDLLRFLGIEKLEDLPEYKDLHKTLGEVLKK